MVRVVEGREGVELSGWGRVSVLFRGARRRAGRREGEANFLIEAAEALCGTWRVS